MQAAHVGWTSCALVHQQVRQGDEQSARQQSDRDGDGAHEQHVVFSTSFRRWELANVVPNTEGSEGTRNRGDVREKRHVVTLRIATHVVCCVTFAATVRVA